MTKGTSEAEVLKAIITRRDALLAERTEIRAKIARLAARDRDIDGEIADCAGAARIFELDIEFPASDRLEIISRGSSEPSPRTPADIGVPAAQMPKLGDLILDYLRNRGPRGSKAAPIQDYIERTYSTQIHDKSVGMTLYRLAKKGLVRRHGHTWFIMSNSTD